VIPRCPFQPQPFCDSVTTEVPANPCHAGILGFCDLSQNHAVILVQAPGLCERGLIRSGKALQLVPLMNPNMQSESCPQLLRAPFLRSDAV